MHWDHVTITDWGWRYHHIGIPTNKKIANEKYLKEFNIAVGGFESSPFGIEWMRFDDECSMPDLIKNVPHIAFEVDIIDQEIKRNHFNILRKSNSPSEGV